MNRGNTMIRTVEELIKHLQDTYELDEIVVGTIYTSADITDYLDESDDGHAWSEIADNFALAIEQTQEELNEYLNELVEEYKDNNSDEAID
jgi:hypothetical protein